MAAHGLCRADERYSCVLNGRFKGGWTTRHYGRPARNIHAIQMELAQSTYLEAESPPWDYSPARALQIRHTLSRLLGKPAHTAMHGSPPGPPHPGPAAPRVPPLEAWAYLARARTATGEPKTAVGRLTEVSGGEAVDRDVPAVVNAGRGRKRFSAWAICNAGAGSRFPTTSYD